MESQGQIVRVLVYQGDRTELENQLAEAGTSVPLNGSRQFGGVHISSTVARADVLCSACRKAVTTSRNLICTDCQISAEKIARRAFEEGEIDVD